MKNGIRIRKMWVELETQLIWIEGVCKVLGMSIEAFKVSFGYSPSKRGWVVKSCADIINHLALNDLKNVGFKMISEVVAPDPRASVEQAFNVLCYNMVSSVWDLRDVPSYVQETVADDVVALLVASELSV